MVPKEPTNPDAGCRRFSSNGLPESASAGYSESTCTRSGEEGGGGGAKPHGQTARLPDWHAWPELILAAVRAGDPI